MDLSNLSSNWKTLQATLKQAKSTDPPNETRGLKRKRYDFEQRGRKSSRTHDIKKPAGGKMSPLNNKVHPSPRPDASAPSDSQLPQSSSATVSVNAGLSTKSVRSQRHCTHC